MPAAVLVDLYEVLACQFQRAQLNDSKRDKSTKSGSDQLSSWPEYEPKTIRNLRIEISSLALKENPLVRARH